MRRLAAICVGLALAACGAPSAPAGDASAEPIARAFYDEVAAGTDVSDDPHLAHELKNPTTTNELALYRAMIPPEPPTRVETRDLTAKTDETGVTTRIVHAYVYADRTLVAQTVLFRSPAGREPVIVGFNLSQEGG